MLILVALVVVVAIVFVVGKNCYKVWADYTALSAIISGISFFGVLYTVYMIDKTSKEDLKARHILIQIEEQLRWFELHNNNQALQAEFLVNIGYLQKELSKISGFDSEYLFKCRNEEGLNVPKSYP
jgi:hypothetical protein